MIRTAILCLAILSLATSSAAQPQKDLARERVSLIFNRVPVAEVFPSLAKSLGYDLSLDPGLRALRAAVTIQVENVTAQTALTAICESIGCRWRQDGKLLIVETAPYGYVRMLDTGRGGVFSGEFERLRTTAVWGRYWTVASLDAELPADVTWSAYPLSEAIATLADAFAAGADLEPSLGDRKVSVVIKSMSLRQALDAVCAVAGCRWELVEGPPVRRLRIPPAPSRRVRVSDASGPSAQKAAPATAERIYEPNEPGVTLPVLLSERKPQYTAEAMRARIQGLVKLAAVVRPDGAVGDVWIVQSLDRVYGLDDEAMKALRQWRFTPGTRDGHPVAVRVELEMQFTLAPR